MTDLIIRIIELGGYPGIVFLMALENVVPPIPSELIMGLGGMAVARGSMQFWPLLAAGTLGTTLGNLFWYELGQRIGYRRLRPWIDRWGRWLTVDWQHVEAASAFFRRHGQWVIFASRFSPVMRTLLSLPAGLAHMRRGRFVLFTAAGAVIWNAILIHGGRLFAGWTGDAKDIAGWTIAATIIGVLAWYGWRVATWQPRD